MFSFTDTYSHLNTASEGDQGSYDKSYPGGSSAKTPFNNDEAVYEAAIEDDEGGNIYQNPDGNLFPITT